MSTNIAKFNATPFKLLKSVAKKSVVLAPLVVLAIAATEPAFAGQDGAEFDTIWDTITGWTTGTLGRVVSGGMILIGIIAGMARQSLMSFATGIGGGMGLYNAPTVIEAIIQGTVQSPEKMMMVMQLSNGMI